MRLLDQTFTQIDTNPTMVAQVSVPWHKGEKAVGPMLASLAKPASGAERLDDLSGVPAAINAADEDAAESARAPDERAVPTARPVPAPPAAALVSAIRPTPRPAVAADTAVAVAADKTPPASKAAPVRIAANVPVPQMRPSVTSGLGEGDVDSPAPQPGRNWTIQIGAYAARSLASTQLANYAGKARDVLHSATRIIDPVQASDGQTLYRARFGLYAEREARAVCSRLTQRGQTCFAAVQAR